MLVSLMVLWFKKFHSNAFTPNINFNVLVDVTEVPSPGGTTTFAVSELPIWLTSTVAGDVSFLQLLKMKSTLITPTNNKLLRYKPLVKLFFSTIGHITASTKLSYIDFKKMKTFLQELLTCLIIINR